MVKAYQPKENDKYYIYDIDKDKYHPRKGKLTKGELEVETTRLWSKPGLEVLAVPGTSMITCRLNKGYQLFLLLKGNVPFQEAWVV